MAPWVGLSSLNGNHTSRFISLGLVGALTGGVTGLAVSGVADLDLGHLCGVQVAGALSAAARVHGVQISGVTSLAQEMNGLQVAGITNVGSSVNGVQFAGITNIGSALNGVQVAGVANVTGAESAGVQVAPINVSAAPVHGVQIGVINVASDADFQLGVVNIDLAGRFKVDAWALPEMGLLMAGVKHGGAHYHWLYGVGTRVDDAEHPWAALGLGAHMTPTSRLFVDLDGIFHAQLTGDSATASSLSEVRAVVGYELVPRFAVFAGPAFNVLAAGSRATPSAPGYASHLASTGSTTFTDWPGVVVGLEGL